MPADRVERIEMLARAMYRPRAGRHDPGWPDCAAPTHVYFRRTAADIIATLDSLPPEQRAAIAGLRAEVERTSCPLCADMPQGHRCSECRQTRKRARIVDAAPPASGANDGA